ncbi:hypothetical protein SCHPADRAFT_936932 [Schizopora paradoxa]|uniref:Uncharacterized protein n=1 Tax=Schizopora paradoxa TaxID=27342 RepID=A0A0H2SKG5_9AGAM|nr:hypothetical protein SCHPADRAFT_936932 [Schizopora paradoxa]
MEVTARLTILLLFALSHQAFGKNDWTKPCHDGICRYDIEEDSTSMGGTIEISGSTSAISDVTPAAGWDILNCTDSTNTQTILLACTDESLGCNHIFDVDAKDTIIRLPQDCGSGPFVRVVDHWIPEVDLLSPNLTSKLERRNIKVHALQIDDHFEQMSNLHGAVLFQVNAQGPLQAVTKHRKRQNGSGFENTNITVPNNSLFSFFNDQLSCPVLGESTMPQQMSAELTISSMSLQVTLSMVSRGTLNPPSVTSLNFSTPTTGHITGTLSVRSFLQGIVNSVGAEIVNIALPPFLIDGIMTTNPSFVITLNSVGLAQLQSNMVTDVVFLIDIEVLFNYPTNSPPATVDISVFPTSAFAVSLMPSENSNVQLELNAVFQLIVEVSAFTSFVDLSVLYDLGHNIAMTALPSEPNNEEVCVNVTKTFEAQVSNDGPFFVVFEEASSLPLFEKEITVLSTCKVVPLGPSPPITRFTRSSLYERDVLSCAPTLAVSQDALSFEI